MRARAVGSQEEGIYSTNLFVAANLDGDAGKRGGVQDNRETQRAT